MTVSLTVTLTQLLLGTLHRAHLCALRATQRGVLGLVRLTVRVRVRVRVKVAG